MALREPADHRGRLRRYFKRRGESELGEGTVYIEYCDDWPARQVEIYGDRWFDSRTPYHPDLGPGLSDQPLSEHGMLPEHEISAAEFERVWQEAVRRAR
jgi:hypothetical protein